MDKNSKIQTTKSKQIQKIKYQNSNKFQTPSTKLQIKLKLPFCF